MDIKRLEYFFAVAEEGSFTRAAKKCFISQTAISKQINVLESIVEFRLFDRRPYRPALTAAGKCFYFSSKKLVDDYYKAVQKAKLLKDGYKETIRIGICGAAENKLLPPILKSFMEDLPETNIDISEGNFFSLSKDLSENRLEIIFGIANDIDAMDNSIYYPLFSNKLVVICAENHHYSHRSNVYGKELKDENIIIFSKAFGPKYHEQFIKACQQDGFQPRIAKEVNSLDEMILMVCMNKGIAIIGEEVLTAFEYVHVSELKETHHYSSYGIAINKNNNNPLVDTFIKVTKKQLI